jgi:hypothetical protein
MPTLTPFESLVKWLTDAKDEAERRALVESTPGSSRRWLGNEHNGWHVIDFTYHAKDAVYSPHSGPRGEGGWFVEWHGQTFCGDAFATPTPQPTPHKTNVEAVVDMMEFSKFGAMAQLVIMTAIEKYCTLAANERLAEKGMINPDAWQGAAKEILEKINAHYGR